MQCAWADDDDLFYHLLSIVIRHFFLVLLHFGAYHHRLLIVVLLMHLRIIQTKQTKNNTMCFSSYSLISIFFQFQISWNIMKYVEVKTAQGVVIYVPKEKHLYSRHKESKTKKIFTCYQKTLNKRKVNIFWISFWCATIIKSFSHF